MAREPRQVAKEIVRSLRECGHAAYFAGGCVRDELLGLHPKDYDVATDATPEHVAGIFRRVREVGRSFGVMLVHRSRVTVEVTTFRREGVYTDKRRPDDIEYCDAKTDAQRRDFTINALFIDPLASEKGEVIDYVGGLEDLAGKTLRAVGDPDRRLAEDHLRALRAVRFAARLGFEIEPKTSRAIERHASELAGVSRERIGEELRMMLRDPSRARAVWLIESLGLDAPVFEEPVGEASESRSMALVDSLPSNASVALALAGWGVARSGGPVEAIDPQDLVRRWRPALCLSNDERDRVAGILSLARRLHGEWDALSVAQRKRASSSRYAKDALALLGATDHDRAQAIRREIEALRGSKGGVEPEPLVTGDDLIGEGLDPGPEFAAWLREAYDAQLEGRIATRGEALVLIRELARSADSEPRTPKTGG